MKREGNDPNTFGWTVFTIVLTFGIVLVMLYGFDQIIS